MSAVRPIVAAVLASVALVAAPRLANAAVPGLEVHGKDYSKSVSKDDFGAGFQLYANATARDYAKLCTYTEPTARCQNTISFMKPVCQMIWKSQHDYYCGKGNTVGYSAEGKAGADLTLFGKDFDLFSISGGAYVEPESTTASYGVWVLGKKIKGASASEISMDIPLAERTLVTAEATFELGPVPITVSAEATGSLGIELAMSAGSRTIGGRARPYAGVDGVFSAGVGVKGASVGVYGDLLLVQVSTPGNASVTYLGNKSFSYDTSLDLQINALDGAVGLYGEFLSYRKQWEIFSWSGLQYTTQLGRAQGSFAL